MTIGSNKTTIVIASGILVTTTACATYLGEPLLFLLPVALIGCVFLMQYPVVLFYLLLLAIPWSAEFNFTESLGTDLPDEPLMLLMAFSSIALFLYKRKEKAFQQKWHLLLWLLLLQVVWIFIAVLLSTYFTLSAKYFLAKGWYLLAFVAAPLLLGGDEKFVKHSAGTLLCSMGILTLVILGRHLHYDFTFAGINKAVRPFFRNHVTYSALLVFMVPLQVAFLRISTNKKLQKLLRVCLAITVAAICLSYARGAWIALLGGIIAYWLLKKRWLFKSFIAVILLSILSVLWLRHNDRYLAFAHDYKTTIFHQNFEEHLAATYQMKDVSTAERFHRWIAGVRMADDSWLTGFGPSTFYQHYKSYTVPAFKTWVSKNEEQSTVHNYFLLLMVEQGAIGLLLFLILLAAMFWYVQKIYHRTGSAFWKNVVAAIGSILVMICTLNFLSDLIETDKVGSVFYLCIAFLIIADKATRTLNTNYTN